MNTDNEGVGLLARRLMRLRPDVSALEYRFERRGMSYTMPLTVEFIDGRRLSFVVDVAKHWNEVERRVLSFGESALDDAALDYQTVVLAYIEKAMLDEIVSRLPEMEEQA